MHPGFLTRARGRGRASASCFVLLAAVAAAHPASAQVRSGDAVWAFVALEEGLVAAPIVRLAFHVTSEGAFATDLEGRLDIERGRRVVLSATGRFGDASVDLRLEADASQILCRNGDVVHTGPRPAHLDDALLIGFTRMGILHNLARLTGAREPDHANGGVREWVGVDGVTRRGNGALAFDIVVAGQPAGHAALELDHAGRPTVRHQTVQFPGGEMHVTERYVDVVIQPTR